MTFVVRIIFATSITASMLTASKAQALQVDNDVSRRAVGDDVNPDRMSGTNVVIHTTRQRDWGDWGSVAINLGVLTLALGFLVAATLRIAHGPQAALREQAQVRSLIESVAADVQHLKSANR